MPRAMATSPARDRSKPITLNTVLLDHPHQTFQSVLLWNRLTYSVPAAHSL